jgi:hypothetical protein
MQMINVEETHQRLVREIEERETQRMKDFVARKKAARAEAEATLPEAIKRYKAAGMDVTKLDAAHQANVDARAKQLDEIKKRYAAKASEAKVIAPEITRAQSLDSALDPPESAALVPAWAGVFSSKDSEDKLSGGTGTDIPNPTVVDAWCWASGAGNGWFGSGAGEYRVTVDWGYWYLVPRTRWYSVATHDTFRGFYIVRSFDDWWISAYARAVVTARTNVWQYNWKGWTTATPLDVGGDNINVNLRFDADRHFYRTALLAGGDWAFIQSRIELYVYARAGGSYSELNFAVGNANYLAAPHVHIY